jgi:cytochrome b6-f complex subunit 5
MVEPLLSGIVLGLVPVTIIGLFVTAYLQFRRRDQLNVLVFVQKIGTNLLFCSYLQKRIFLKKYLYRNFL